MAPFTRFATPVASDCSTVIHGIKNESTVQTTSVVDYIEPGETFRADCLVQERTGATFIGMTKTEDYDFGTFGYLQVMPGVIATIAASGEELSPCDYPLKQAEAR